LAAFKYCPQCASPLSQRFFSGRERDYCPSCGFIHFRDPKLAVGALIINEGRVLLIRRAVPPRKGYWAVPSGFVEYDEQPRAALAREVEEETGLQVRVGAVIDVYPNADPTKPGVFLLFEADSVAGMPAPGDDVSEVAWFTGEELPYDDLAFQDMERLRELLRHGRVKG
jgi:8-oxo-dGTP diphosphatase